ncbi:MAG TPA: DMT family transporter [Solirubrobacteraceae bacterium]|nr:DMT family transporter [Solirubrobacteraceae bacterium]
MTPRQITLLSALAAIWGGSYLLIKFALEGFSAPMIVWGRTTLASLVLLIALRGAARGAFADMRRRPGWALVLGTVSVVAPFLLITFGEHEVPSGLTAVLISPAALFVALFAPFIDPSERIDRRQALGLVIGLAGVAVVVGVESISTLGQFLGGMAMIGAAAFYALGGFVVKGRYGRLTSMQTSFVSLSIASLVTLPIAVATAPSETPGLGAVSALLALGAIGTALAFVIFYKLIAEVGAGRASLVSYLAPGVALFYGAVFRDEPITIAAVGGLVLILGGVALASRRSRAPEPVASAVHGPDAVACRAGVS